MLKKIENTRYLKNISKLIEEKPSYGFTNLIDDINQNQYESIKDKQMELLQTFDINALNRMWYLFNYKPKEYNDKREKYRDKIANAIIYLADYFSDNKKEMILDSIGTFIKRRFEHFKSEKNIQAYSYFYELKFAEKIVSHSKYSKILIELCSRWLNQKKIYTYQIEQKDLNLITKILTQYKEESLQAIYSLIYFYTQEWPILTYSYESIEEIYNIINYFSKKGEKPEVVIPALIETLLPIYIQPPEFIKKYSELIKVKRFNINTLKKYQEIMLNSIFNYKKKAVPILFDIVEKNKKSSSKIKHLRIDFVYKKLFSKANRFGYRDFNELENDYLKNKRRKEREARKLEKMKEAPKYIIQGNNHFLNCKFENALKSYKKALKLDSKNIEAIEGLEKTERKLIDLLSPKVNEYLKRVEELLERGEIEKSENLLSETRKLSLSISKLKKPIDECKKLISKKKKLIENEIKREENEKEKRIDFLIKEGNKLFNIDKLEETLLIYKEVLDIMPEHSEALEKIDSIKEKQLYRIHVRQIVNDIRYNIPITITRIAELANAPEKEIKKILNNLLNEKLVQGELLNIENVFIKHEMKMNDSIKNLTCYFCGNPINKEDNICSGCGEKVVYCSVCKLNINFGEDTAKCPLCERFAHITHLQEWVKTQGKCPCCLQEIPIEGVVPVTKQLKK